MHGCGWHKRWKALIIVELRVCVQKYGLDGSNFEVCFKFPILRSLKKLKLSDGIENLYAKIRLLIDFSIAII
jgi:hypothetical protein